MRAAVDDRPWDTAFGGHTRPADWVPHCSLATRLDAATLERGKALLDDGFIPIVATVVALAVVLVGGSGDVGVVPLAGGRPASAAGQPAAPAVSGPGDASK